MSRRLWRISQQEVCEKEKKQTNKHGRPEWLRVCVCVWPAGRPGFTVTLVHLFLDSSLCHATSQTTVQESHNKVSGGTDRPIPLLLRKIKLEEKGNKTLNLLNLDLSNHVRFSLYRPKMENTWPRSNCDHMLKSFENDCNSKCLHSCLTALGQEVSLL